MNKDVDKESRQIEVCFRSRNKLETRPHANQLGQKAKETGGAHLTKTGPFATLGSIERIFS